MAICVLIACATAGAQTVIDERRLGPNLAKFEDAIPNTLKCSVSVIHPALNYSFRYHAGYLVTIPMNQFEGEGHRWRMFTRITPEAGDQRPVYLVSNYRLPPVPKTKVQLQAGGGYLLGEGAYRVRYLLTDEQGRVCRKDWRVEVRRGRGESEVRVGMPPNTVWDVALRGSRVVAPPAMDDAAAIRLTILLHAAPGIPRRTQLRHNDVMMLLASVTSILEHVPVRDVRLVAFNLDQQRELYRKDNFQLRNIPEVADAMYRTELGLVDMQVLQKRHGHLDMIADLVNQEIKAPNPADVVLFLGPTSRFSEKTPQDLLEKPEGRAPRFLFFQLAPHVRTVRGLASPDDALPDSIRHAVSRTGGKTTTIRTPADLARAIGRLKRATNEHE